MPSSAAFRTWLDDTALKILSAEKAAIFQSLITYPLPTVDVTTDAYKELFKVFFASDRVIDYFFTDEEIKTDFIKYLEHIGEPEYWQKNGWEIMKNHVNGAMVVDLPALDKDITSGEPEFLQSTDRPEPYFYFVDTGSIIDLVVNQQGDTEWIAFSAILLDDQEVITLLNEDQAVTEVSIVLDDEFYRRYIRIDNSPDWVLDLEFPHDLGYCPSRQFWSTNLGSSKIQRANPETDVLGELDWLLFSIIMKRHLELYAGFPIISSWDQNCDYRTADGFQCNRGVLSRMNVDTHEEEVKEEGCPVCSVSNKLVGPGAHFRVNAPTSKEDDVGMPAVEITTGDTDSLEMMGAGLKAKIASITKKMVGFDGEPDNEQAKNEKQVASSFESRQIVLQNIAFNFQTIQHFVVKTIGKLRYGTDFIGATVNYGRQFFMTTGSELQAKYKDDRENAMPYFEQDHDRERIYIDRYKNNPEMSARTAMLMQLEPLQDLSLEEIDSNRDIIPRQKRTLKINFNQYIDRFERENGPITQFLSNIDDMPVRINTIQAELMLYVSEDLENTEPVVVPEGGSGDE